LERAVTTSDKAARLRALTELDSTLLVEAAAGTGKTSLLAGRVIMLLAAGISPALIAAITFTELAAGELRQRVARYSIYCCPVPFPTNCCCVCPTVRRRRKRLPCKLPPHGSTN
jgi:hypothetical protein